MEPFHLELPTSKNTTDGSPDSKPQWLAEISRLGLRQPDKIAVPINGDEATADAAYQSSRALIFLSPPSASTTAYAQDRGYTVIVFPPDMSEWLAIFASHATIFGTPSSHA
ncbi:MAG: hypothetical protein NTY98_05365 [Verrucomicrobia bacterium]|nr:hypothetical protein [Verrucomicrobiota bacterium]